MFNKKILAGIAFAGTAFASLALGPGEAPFSYNKTNEQKNPYGYGRKETLSTFPVFRAGLLPHLI